MKRIIFIQLPLINHSYDYIQGNIEYASAAIAGYINKNVSSEHVAYPLPEVLAQFGSDSMIVAYILASSPDIVAFTCFLWNIERNLNIAQLIKSNNNSIRIIFGGSEINTGSVALLEKRECVDYFVIGEGEWFFNRLLREEELGEYQLIFGGNRVIVQPNDELIPARMIYEPFTGKRIMPMLDGSMFFELTRGCPYRCAYCLYSKNYTCIRELSFETLVRALTDGEVSRNLKELYILSPALNTTRDFKKKLERLADLKHGIRLHSEMRAGGIDAHKARRIYRAGFRSMEVGLQTMNIESLQAAGRSSKPERELRGVRCLLDAGIEIKIGLMPGLPGDDRDFFIRMVDTLVHKGFQENIELYPLMILPGTAIRDRADRDAISYSRKPPYYYHDGWGMSFDDIRYITAYAEEATGMSHIVRKIPDFTFNDEGLYCRGIRFNGNYEEKWNFETHAHYVETNVFSFYITDAGERSISRGLPRLINGMPDHMLFNIIFYSNEYMDEPSLVSIMQEHDRDTFFRRVHIFHEWQDGCTLRFYQVFERYEQYRRAKESYSVIIPIFHIRKINCEFLSCINDYEDYILVEKGIYGMVMKEMKKFADSAHTVAFEDEREQEEFYSMIEYDYIRLPFRFRVISR